MSDRVITTRLLSPSVTVYTREWLETPITIDRVTAHISTAANTRLPTVRLNPFHTRVAIFFIRSILSSFLSWRPEYDLL